MHKYFRSALLLTALAMPMAAHAQTGAGVNYESRLGQIEEQMRSMNGRIEQMEFNVKRLEQALQRMQTDVDGRMRGMEQSRAQAASPPPQQSAPPSSVNNVASAYNRNDEDSPTPPPPPQPTSANGTLGALKVLDGRITGGSVNPQAPPLPQAPPDYSLTSQEQYDRAFDLLRQADYDEAGEAFEAFIQKNPNDKLIDNAKYWYGETLYVRRKFDVSAVAFADAYQQNPNGAKAADSLLKMAMSLENLGKIPDACATLDSLKSKFPNASASTRQRGDKEREKLKCAALSAGH